MVYKNYIKRILDIICALAALIVFCWLYAIVAILVRIKLGSPMIFKQERPGMIDTAINAEGRPIWKPMHMQPMYRMHECVGREGTIRCRTNAYIAGGVADVGADIFQRGCCLPSDNKMTVGQQDRIIEVIRECFE